MAMNGFVKVLACAAGAICGQALADNPKTWDATADFSAANGNPNGPWSYGWYDVGFNTFSLYATSAQFWTCPGWTRATTGDWTPNVVLNSCGNFTVYNVPVGWLTLHPSPATEPSVIRFTVPAGAHGPFQVTGEFNPGDGGSVQVAVRHNAAELFHAVNAGVFDLTVYAAAGDTIEFAAYGAYGFGNTPVRAVINGMVTCRADMGGTGGVPGADGVLDNNDFVVFIDRFFNGSAGADVGMIGGQPGSDGLLDNNDFVVFIDLFFAGC